MHPLNHLRDEPPTRQSFAKLLGLLKEGKDWQNLPGFLEGLKTAKRKLTSGQLEKMVRKANLIGRQGVILECLRRVEGTGVGLWDVKVVREVMLGAMMKAHEGNWEKGDVEQAIKLARAVWDLTEDSKHAVKARDVGPENVPRTRPDIVGVMVQLEAAKAILSGEGKDEGGKVEGAVEMLLGCWADTEIGSGGMKWFDANHKLTIWAPVWHGTKLARKVLGEESKYGKTLEEIIKRLEPVLEEARDIVVRAPQPKRLRRGVKMYEELSSVSL